MGNTNITYHLTCLILGQERSGKSVLLQRMVMKEVPDTELSSTLGFNFEYFSTEGKNVGVIEMGGSDLVREYWEEMYSYVKLDVVIYVLRYRENMFHMKASNDVLLHSESAMNHTQTMDGSVRAGNEGEGGQEHDENSVKQVYRSLNDLKILINEECLRDCFFFIVVNIESDKTSNILVEHEKGKEDVVAAIDEDDYKKRNKDIQEALGFHNLPCDKSRRTLCAANLRIKEEFTYLWEDFRLIEPMVRKPAKEGSK